MTRCLIADDEVIAQQILEQYILQTDGLMLVGKCRNAMEAFAKLEQQQVDLIFLDIDMPLVNGITFLKSLKTPPKAIFTTAYAEYALQGYELNVVDYLLKPISYERFSQAVEKARLLLSINQPQATEIPSMVIKEKGGLIRIPYDEIQYIEGSRDYVKIMLAGKSHLVHMTMKKLEEMLPAQFFVRTHKSFIVGIKHIKMIRPADLLLASQQLIPLSPNYREQVTRSFGAI